MVLHSKQFAKIAQIQGGMIDLLQLECLTGLEEAMKLVENPIVQVWEKKDTLLQLVLMWYVMELFRQIRTPC